MEAPLSRTSLACGSIALVWVRGGKSRSPIRTAREACCRARASSHCLTLLVPTSLTARLFGRWCEREYPRVVCGDSRWSHRGSCWVPTREEPTFEHAQCSARGGTRSEDTGFCRCGCPTARGDGKMTGSTQTLGRKGLRDFETSGVFSVNGVGLLSLCLGQDSRGLYLD